MWCYCCWCMVLLAMGILRMTHANAQPNLMCKDCWSQSAQNQIPISRVKKKISDTLWGVSFDPGLALFIKKKTTGGGKRYLNLEYAATTISTCHMCCITHIQHQRRSSKQIGGNFARSAVRPWSCANSNQAGGKREPQSLVGATHWPREHYPMQSMFFNSRRQRFVFKSWLHEHKRYVQRLEWNCLKRPNFKLSRDEYSLTGDYRWLKLWGYVLRTYMQIPFKVAML